MIFGEREEFALEVDRFDPPWESIDPADSVWAAVAIWVAGSNLTEHWRVGTDRVRDDLHVPLVPLALWIARTRDALCFEERSQFGAFSSPHEELNRWSLGPPAANLDEDAWLDRRDAWWSRHFTGAATGDTVAPSVGIVRNDDRALISWRTAVLPRPDRTFVVPRGDEVVSWAVVSRALEEYVAAVASWAAPGSGFELNQSHNGRALEYYTGLPAAALQPFGFLPEAAHDPALDPLAQVVRDLTHRTSTGPAQTSIVKFVRARGWSGSHDWWALRGKLLASSGMQFEREGYDAARTVRGVLGLDGQPIPDMEKLTSDLDVEVATEAPAAVADRMIVVGGAAGQATAMVFRNARTATAWGRRFELARALGHLLLDPLRGDAIGAASGPQAIASRRRRSGAFAAEFLLPTTALAEASDGVLDGVAEGARFAGLLDRFGVGASTAAFQLWNHGFLSSTEMRDDLIASA